MSDPSYADDVVSHYLEATEQVARGDEDYRPMKAAAYRRVLQLHPAALETAFRQAGEIERYWGTICVHCHRARRHHVENKCLFDSTYYSGAGGPDDNDALREARRFRRTGTRRP